MPRPRENPAFAPVSPPCDTAYGQVRVWRHRSGARVVHIDDGRDEQGFAIGFPAPVTDGSGVAHVLEHLVFRGSRRCPDDQLYTALRGGSLASHLNATTGAEMTSYHMASPLPADALRLQEALLDAVFHPLLTRDAFAQEAFDAETGTAGVVMNEMRGHLAQPAARADHALRRALFPDQPMGRCYGGDPDALRDLQWEQVTAFHRRHYHPARALVLLTGKGDPAANLSLLGEVFDAWPVQKACELPDAPLAAAAGDEVAGWILPATQDAWQGMVLAELLMDDVGRHGLSPASGLVAGRPPYLALFGPSAARADLAGLSARLTPAMITAVETRLRARASDPEGDFRLPAGLQIWPALCAAHLQGVEPDLALTPANPCDMNVLQDALRAMADVAPRVVTAHKDAVPSKPSTPTPPHILPQTEILRPAKPPHFAPLPLSHLPEDPPPPPFHVKDGIRLLPESEGPYLRIALWCGAAHLPDDLRRHLPRLAASAKAALGCDAAPHHGAQAGLALSVRLERGAVTDWLSAFSRWCDAPPDAPPVPFAAPLAAEIRLRAALSQKWAQLGALVAQDGPPPQDLRDLAQAVLPLMRIATSDPSAIAVLAKWRSQWPDASAQPAAPAPMAPQNAVVTARDALFTLGLGLDAGQLPPVHAALVLRAVEAAYLWPLLRVSGGAYGIRATQDGALLTMISLRDPQGMRSLDLMRQAAAWLAKHADAQMLHQAQLAAAALALKPRALSARLGDLAQTDALPSPLSIAAIKNTSLSELQQAAARLAATEPVTLIQAAPDALRAAGLR